jgi:hypothetical protein
MMARGKSTFRQRDVTAAIKGVQKAGCEVARVEVEDGKIIVIAGKPTEAAAEAGQGTNEWDGAS